ncbi:DNA-3-methyladenine glycosylase I [uncultured Williamsia sp.]|uniref:DNA-3-methyladenine glycosylase I n=1 Tax=uncultured Williamsia sp. TaxID=259311 RepID=UPI00260484BD|nr:DNA-3-methyladenine glycosylase I [uncultured Williamsia sp.]
MTEREDLIVGGDGRSRPIWAARPGLMQDYYDTEWGCLVHGENAYFERLSLEGFQSGLSWATILRKRPAFREVFRDFDVDTVAGFTDDDVERLMGDARIVRNRAKIEATIGNARATQTLRQDGGLEDLIWSFRPETTPTPQSMADVPTVSAESTALSKELRRRGFRFVGPTTAFALMEALGVVDTHLVGSHRRGSSGVWAPDGAFLGRGDA